jgi:hypothetical protein
MIPQPLRGEWIDTVPFGPGQQVGVVGEVSAAVVAGVH